MPTDEQAQACLRVCHMLSNAYCPIYVFRYDESTNSVYVLAGVNEGIEIIISSNGIWELIDG